MHNAVKYTVYKWKCIVIWVPLSIKQGTSCYEKTQHPNAHTGTGFHTSRDETNHFQMETTTYSPSIKSSDTSTWAQKVLVCCPIQLPVLMASTSAGHFPCCGKGKALTSIWLWRVPQCCSAFETFLNSPVTAWGLPSHRPDCCVW